MGWALSFRRLIPEGLQSFLPPKKPSAPSPAPRARQHWGVEDLAKEIVIREGGYVNDPDDPGGATKFGITIWTAKRFGLDLNRDSRVDSRDVALITKEIAVDIFVEQYFKRPGLWKLPVGVQPAVFDMQVNAGNQAVRILQRLLGDLGFSVVVDGRIGPQTADAAAKAEDEGETPLAYLYGAARREYYYRLADLRPASRKYCLRRDGGKGGWIRRAEEFMPPKLHFTDAQHKARVQKWS